MKTRMVSEENMPATPGVNSIMPLSIIDQDACTAPRVRPDFFIRVACFIFYVLVLYQPHKIGRL